MTLSKASGNSTSGRFVQQSREAVEDKENIIVQPFINLLNEEQYGGAQLIMTGASFAGLVGAHFQRLTQVHVAK